MEQFRNFGVIKTQKYLSTFEWNEIEFNSYIIEFENIEGIFKINRSVEYEQALIGAQIMFNASEDLSSIKKYKIMGFQKKESKVKQLLKQREERFARKNSK
jgi:hypothetical protein